jgi:hypothetical protein
VGLNQSRSLENAIQLGRNHSGFFDIRVLLRSGLLASSNFFRDFCPVSGRDGSPVRNPYGDGSLQYIATNIDELEDGHYDF